MLLALQNLINLRAAAAQTIAEQEWNWDEVVQSDFVVLGYQNSNAVAAVQNPPGVDWDWGEHAPADVIPTGYQNADAAAAANPLLCASHEWDWDETIYSDVTPTGYQNADAAVAANPAQQPQEDWDFSSDFGGEDGWSNHYTAYDLPQVFGFEWDWDEFVGGEFTPIGYQNADFTPPVALSQPADLDWDFSSDFGGEDGWANHFTNYDAPTVYDAEWNWDECVFGEFQVLGYQQADAPQVPPTLVLNLEGAWNWDEFGEDDWQEESQPVGLDGPYIPPVVADTHRPRRHSALHFINDTKAFVAGHALGRGHAHRVSARVTNPAALPPPVELSTPTPEATASASVSVHATTVMPSARAQAQVAAISANAGAHAEAPQVSCSAAARPVVAHAGVCVQVQGVSARALAREPDEVYAGQSDDGDDDFLATIASLFD
jgi:hypothetical protein